MSIVPSNKEDCLFCKMVRGEIPVTKLYEDELCFVIKDIHPRAPTHLLVIPKHHIESLLETEAKDKSLLGHMLHTLKTIAQTNGLEGGFKTVINSGALSGQEILHLHFHLLGGPTRSLSWV